MKEPEYEELNIEKPQKYNDLNNKHEQLCFRVYRPFKCNEFGKVGDDTCLAYDRLLIMILTWLILKRKHLLKSKVVFNEEFLNSMIKHQIQKKRLFVYR